MIKLKTKRDCQLFELQPLYIQLITKAILSKGSEDDHCKLDHHQGLFNTKVVQTVFVQRVL